MLSKLTTLASVLMLAVLVFAPLVLAQQDTTAPAEQPIDTTQAPPTNLPNPLVLDQNNNLTIDCAVASNNLAQLAPLRETLANDPDFQSRLAEAEELVHLCADNGSSPLDSVGSKPSEPNSAGFQQYQRVGQTQTTTMSI